MSVCQINEDQDDESNAQFFEIQVVQDNLEQVLNFDDKRMYCLKMQLNLITMDESEVEQQSARQTELKERLKIERYSNIQVIREEVHYEQRFKNKIFMVGCGSIISLSGVMFGYSLTEISGLDQSVLVEGYGFSPPGYNAQSILIGIMPIGGMFGALLTQLFLKKFKRKTSLFLFTLFYLFTIGLCQITTPATFIIGRFLEGIVIGLYAAISPIYLREIQPKQLRPQTGGMFSLCKVLGFVILYALTLIIGGGTNFPTGFRLILSFGGIIAVIQAICLYFIVPDSPAQMVEKGKLEEAKVIIESLYKPEFVDEVLNQYLLDYQTQKKKNQIDITNKNGDLLIQKRWNAQKMAINIAILGQLIGGNAIITFSGPIVSVFNATEGKYTPISVTGIELIMNYVAVLLITKKVGRRPLLTVSILILILTNFAIAISLFLQQEIAIIMFMCFFMFIDGASFLPTYWTYPSEIVPAQKALLQNVLNWFFTALVTSIPPIVVNYMPNNNAYPLFIFFGFSSIFGLIYAHLYMIESKGRTFQQIISEY